MPEGWQKRNIYNNASVPVFKNSTIILFISYPVTKAIILWNKIKPYLMIECRLKIRAELLQKRT